MVPVVDERALIRQSRQGDQRSFERLVALKRDGAFRIAFNIVGDEDDAKDIAQQSFIRLWSAIAGFDESAPFDPWFSRIVVNLAIDFHRREKKRIRPVPGDAEGKAEAADPAAGRLAAADTETSRREIRRVFEIVAAGLGPVQRAVFTLREIEGLDTDQIAAIMEIRPSTVRNHLMQARRKLREALRRRFPEYARDFGPEGTGR